MAFRAKVKLANRYFKNKTSFPLLSQDAFRMLCDIQIESKSDLKNLDVHEARSAQVIYINSGFLSEFLSNDHRLFSPKVIISGGSDTDFFDIPGNFPASAKLVLLQNSHISDLSRIHTLPIGVENLKMGMNGFPGYMKQRVPWSEKSNSCLVGPFGLTHPDRYLIGETLNPDSKNFFIARQRLSPRKFSRFANNFKFTLAMRGNGEDTHRFWETLYRGSLPIVKRSPWSESLKFFNFPFIEVDNWHHSEILMAMSAFSERPLMPKNQDFLWLPHWEKLIKNYL